MKKVLKFQATWCGPCKAMSKTLENVQTDVLIEEVDIDENSELTTQYGIRGVPTLVMLQDGVEVKRLVGAKNKEELENWINQ